MKELERTLVAESAAASPSHILEGLTEEIANRRVPGAPHSIYEELWHLAFWQQVTLDWVDGTETPYPASAGLGFPSAADLQRESVEQLCRRFLDGTVAAAAAARDEGLLEQSIRCPSPPGKPVRTMSVREQLENLAAHNAYHLGRIVLLRQLHGAWPPVSGGFTW
jgi:uncharacterized damage-inducible protein DinB